MTHGKLQRRAQSSFRGSANVPPTSVAVNWTIAIGDSSGRGRGGGPNGVVKRPNDARRMVRTRC